MAQCKPCHGASARGLKAAMLAVDTTSRLAARAVTVDTGRSRRQAKQQRLQTRFSMASAPT